MTTQEAKLRKDREDVDSIVPPKTLRNNLYRCFLEELKDVVAIYYFPNDPSYSKSPYCFFNGEKNCRKILATFLVRIDANFLDDGKSRISVKGILEAKSPTGGRVLINAKNWVRKNIDPSIKAGSRKGACRRVISLVTKCALYGQNAELYFIRQNEHLQHLRLSDSFCFDSKTAKFKLEKMNEEVKDDEN